MTDRACYLVAAGLCLTLTIVVPIPEPPEQPIDPVGVWEVRVSGEARYVVTVRAGDLPDTWVTEWRDEANRLDYAGVMMRNGKALLEVYVPPGRACRPWHHAGRPDGGLDNYPRGSGPGEWVLQRAKADF